MERAEHRHVDVYLRWTSCMLYSLIMFHVRDSQGVPWDRGTRRSPARLVSGMDRNYYRSLLRLERIAEFKKPSSPRAKAERCRRLWPLLEKGTQREEL